MLADCADRLVQIFAKKRADDLRLLFNRAFLPLGHDLIQPARALRLHGAGYSHDAVLQFTRTVLERGNRLGFRSASYDELAKKFDPEKLHYGCNTVDGEEIYYIPNPALRRWINREKF